VGLAAGIDGLVHLSDLSWNEPGEAAVRNYKKGQEVEAIVLAVDVERERISLGIKQLDGDPFTTFVTVNDKGQTVTGKVKTVDARGAEIDLGEDIIGYLRASKSPRPRGRCPQRAEGRRRSHRRGGERGSQDPQHPAVDQGQGHGRPERSHAVAEPAIARESAGTTSLGALLRAKLDNSDK
jgi:small subunit ribosomal protein S1